MAYKASADSSAVFLWTVIFIGVVLSLTFYILSCMGLMKIADKNGIRYSYLAWIPIINLFLLGKIGFKSTVTAIIFFILSFTYFGLFFASAFSTVGANSETLFFSKNYYVVVTKGNSILSPMLFILLIIFIVMYLIALYRIYRKMSTKSVMMFIFSILSSGLLIPIFLFAIRNNPLRINIK